MAGCGGSGGGKSTTTPAQRGADIERAERNELAASLAHEESAEQAKDRELLAQLEAKKREEEAEAKAKKTEAEALARAKKREAAAVKAVKLKERAAEAKAKKREEALQAEIKKQQEEEAKKKKEEAGKHSGTRTVKAPVPPVSTTSTSAPQASTGG